MVASAYCEPADLHDHGLPRGSLPNPGRIVADVDAGTETLSLDEHGFRNDTPLLFRAESGGSLPAPLVEGTTYYAIVATDSTFQVAAAPGGGAINLTTAGSNVLVVAPLPKQAAIEWASAIVDDALIAHGVPLTAPYPVSVVAIVAQLAASKVLSYCGQSSVTLGDAIKAALEQVKAWNAGKPIRGAVVPSPPANLAVTSSSAGVSADPRGWIPCGGTLP